MSQQRNSIKFGKIYVAKPQYKETCEKEYVIAESIFELPNTSRTEVYVFYYDVKYPEDRISCSLKAFFKTYKLLEGDI